MIRRIPTSIRFEIYRLYKEENKRAKELATLFKVAEQTIFRIIREIEGKVEPRQNPLRLKPTRGWVRNKI
jgi:Mor family transcriptional regulator